MANIGYAIRQVESIFMINIDPMHYSEYKDDCDVDFSTLAVSLYPTNILYVKYNEELACIAVMSDPECIWCLQGGTFPNQTPPPNWLCLLVINMDVSVLKQIEHPRELVCLHVLSMSPNNIKYIKEDNQTYLICKYALEKDIKTLQYCNLKIIAEHEDLLNMVKKSDYYKNIT